MGMDSRNQSDRPNQQGRVLDAFSARFGIDPRTRQADQPVNSRAMFPTTPRREDTPRREPASPRREVSLGDEMTRGFRNYRAPMMGRY